jgi:hypothetical protein
MGTLKSVVLAMTQGMHETVIHAPVIGVITVFVVDGDAEDGGLSPAIPVRGFRVVGGIYEGMAAKRAPLAVDEVPEQFAELVKLAAGRFAHGH